VVASQPLGGEDDNLEPVRHARGAQALLSVARLARTAVGRGPGRPAAIICPAVHAVIADPFPPDNFRRFRGLRTRAGNAALSETVDIACSTLFNAVMAKRNLTIQLDEAIIRHAKIAATRRGLSLSSLVAQQLNDLAEADQRYERARDVALEALAGATGGGGGAPSWRREELYDR
jgi:hypothetical protein